MGKSLYLFRFLFKPEQVKKVKNGIIFVGKYVYLHCCYQCFVSYDPIVRGKAPLYMFSLIKQVPH